MNMMYTNSGFSTFTGGYMDPIYILYNRNILGKPLTTMNAIGYNNGI